MEYWDIYDSFKQPTGRKMKRNDWNMKDGDYHLTVLGVLKREDGKFLVTRRAADKSWAPLCWEVPGGGVKAGESSKEAVLREFREETGLDLSAAKGGLFMTYRRDNPDEGDNYFVDVYLFSGDFKTEEVKIDTAETSAFDALTFEDIKKLADEGVFLHFNSIRSVFEL